jgi:Zinc finger found in FPG and IleRS
LGQSLASDIVICARPDFGVTKVALETWKEVLVVSDVVVREAWDFDAHISDLDLIGRSWHRSASILTSNNERCGTVLVASPAKEKCARCWRYAAEAKADDDASLCGRCADVVKELQQ